MTANQCGQQCQDEPPDGLGMDRRLHGSDQPVVVPHSFNALATQRVRLTVEAGQVRCTMPQAHGVLDARRRVGHHELCERLRGEELVGGGRPRLEVELAGDNPDHVQRHGGTERGRRVPANAVRRLGLRRGEERDPDDRADPYAVVPLQ